MAKSIIGGQEQCRNPSASLPSFKKGIHGLMWHTILHSAFNIQHLTLSESAKKNVMARYLACCLAILVVTTLVDAQRSLKTATDEQVNAALNSPRYMRRQMNCLQNLGPCDNIGEEMKRLGPSLVRGKCPGCTPEMHKRANRVLKVTSQQFPEDYKKIYQMYMGKSSKPASRSSPATSG